MRSRSVGGPPGDAWLPNGVIVQVGSESAHSFLYGTSINGGAYGLGTVFRFDFTSGEYTLLHSFTGGSDRARKTQEPTEPEACSMEPPLAVGPAATELCGKCQGHRSRYCTNSASSPKCADGGEPEVVFLPWDAPGDIVGTADSGGAKRDRGDCELYTLSGAVSRKREAWRARLIEAAPVLWCVSDTTCGARQHALALLIVLWTGPAPAPRSLRHFAIR